MARSPLSQTLHDSVVSGRARELIAEGNRVWADIDGYGYPQSIFEHLPDILTNGNRNIISEVETKETYSSQHTKEQLQAFDSANNYRLEVVVPESVYLSALNLFQRWGVTVDDWRTFKD